MRRLSFSLKAAKKAAKAARTGTGRLKAGMRTADPPDDEQASRLSALPQQLNCTTGFPISHLFFSLLQHIYCEPIGTQKY